VTVLVQKGREYNKMISIRKAQEAGLTIPVIIAIVLGLIVLLLVVWLGGKTIGIGKFVGESVV